LHNYHETLDATKQSNYKSLTLFTCHLNYVASIRVKCPRMDVAATFIPNYIMRFGEMETDKFLS